MNAEFFDAVADIEKETPITAQVTGSIPDCVPMDTTVKNTATIRVTLVARPSTPSVKFTPLTVPITAKNRTGTASHPRFR